MSRSLSRASTRLALVVLTLLALTGCTSDVTTTFTVTSPTQAKVSTGVTFTGDAAVVLDRDKATLEQLVGVFTARLGVSPDVERGKDSLSVTATVPYSDLAKVSDITGVRSAALAPSGKGAQLSVDVGPAPKVVDAIRKAAASEPEPQAVTQTMLQSTHLVTRVVFAGGVSTARTTTKVGSLSTDGDVTTLTRTAADAGTTSLLVAGAPSSSRALWLAGGVLVLLAGGGALLRRRTR